MSDLGIVSSVGLLPTASTSNSGSRAFVGTAGVYTEYTSNGISWSPTLSTTAYNCIFPNLSNAPSAASTNVGTKIRIGSVAPYIEYLSDGLEWVPINTPSVITVQPATGNSLTDTVNINNAIIAAGTGGTVIFPPKQTYMIRNYAGSTTVIPRIINGNGSTLMTDAVVYTTIASGSVTTGSTSVVVANSSLFNVGDSLSLTDGAGNFINPTTISAINPTTNTLTVAPITMSQGTTIAAGAVALRNDVGIYFKWPAAASNLALEITGFIVDGNLPNRIIPGAISGQQWSNQQLIELQGIAGYTSAIWIHHNTFQNGPCDGVAVNDVSYYKLQDNHFQNIMGNGSHPGGSGNTFDIIVEGNTFFNVSQFTASTTPSVINYGHVTGYGAIVTSNSPHRLVVANNVVDTAQGRGFDGLNSNNDDTYSVTGNVFYNCTMGGFACSGGKYGAITGNVISGCGHDVAYVAGNKELTLIGATTLGIATQITVTGNTFVESPFMVNGDSSTITICGNNFSNLVNQYGTNYLFSSLYIPYASAGSSKIVVSGNTFRGPMNTAELTAVAGAPLYGIHLDTCTGVNVSGNTVVGYRFGVYLKNSMINVSISDNVLQDQNASSGTSAHGIQIAAGTLKGFKVHGNNISRTQDTSWAWIGIEQQASLSSIVCASITNNSITALVNPASGAKGMEFNSYTMAGFKITDNEIWLNNTGSSAFSGTGSLTSACMITNNVVHNGNVASYGAATVAAGNQAL